MNKMSAIICVGLCIAGILGIWAVAEKYKQANPINKLYDLSLDISLSNEPIIACYNTIKTDIDIETDQNCKLVAWFIATELNIIYESKKYNNIPMNTDNYYANAISVLDADKQKFINDALSNNYYYYASSIFIVTKKPNMVKQNLVQGLVDVMKKGKFDF